MYRNHVLEQIETSIKRRIVEQWPQEKVSELATSTTLAIGAGIAAAAHLLYKRKISPAAQACEDAEDMNEKTRCMNAYKVRALKAEKRHILSGKTKCSDTDCYSYLDNRISQIEAQINKLS